MSRDSSSNVFAAVEGLSVAGSGRQAKIGIEKAARARIRIECERTIAPRFGSKS
jgi:hypothetical protein